MPGHRKWHNIRRKTMTEEEKKIKKWSNEQKVEALAKFIALRSGDPRKAILYGFMLDCLLDEIDKRERKINNQQSELEKKDKMIDLMVEDISCFNNLSICGDCEKIWEDDYDYTDCNKCIKQYFEWKVIPEEK